MDILKTQKKLLLKNIVFNTEMVYLYVIRWNVMRVLHQGCVVLKDEQFCALFSEMVTCLHQPHGTAQSDPSTLLSCREELSVFPL